MYELIRGVSKAMAPSALLFSSRMSTPFLGTVMSKPWVPERVMSSLAGGQPAVQVDVDERPEGRSVVHVVSSLAANSAEDRAEIDSDAFILDASGDAVYNLLCEYFSEDGERETC